MYSLPKTMKRILYRGETNTEKVVDKAREKIHYVIKFLRGEKFVNSGGSNPGKSLILAYFYAFFLL